MTRHLLEVRRLFFPKPERMISRRYPHFALTVLLYQPWLQGNGFDPCGASCFLNLLSALAFILSPFGVFCTPKIDLVDINKPFFFWLGIFLIWLVNSLWCLLFSGKIIRQGLNLCFHSFDIRLGERYISPLGSFNST